jgi:hypothetical protein
MSEPTATPADAPPLAADAATYRPRQYIDSTNKIVDAPTYKDAQTYSNMGYKEATPGDISHDKMVQEYSGWLGAGKSAAYAFARGIPAATSAILSATESALGKDAARSVAQNMQAAQEAHPAITWAVSAAPTTAITMLSDLVLTAGIAGGTAAATGPAAPVTAAASLIPAAIAASATTQAVIANLNTRDAAAIAHLVDPDAEEKILSHLMKDTLTGGAIGAAVPLAVGGLATALKGLGSAAKGLADKAAVATLQNTAKVSDVIHAGANSGMVDAIAKHGLADMEAPAATRYVTQTLDSLGKQMQAIKDAAKVPLPWGDAAGLANSLEQSLGVDASTTAAGKTASAMLADKPATVERLHLVREYLDANVAWGKTTPKNILLNDARRTIETHIDDVFKLNDPTGTQAAAWRATNTDYSDLLRVKNILRKAGPQAEAQGVSWAVPAYISAASMVQKTVLGVSLPFVAKAVVAAKSLSTVLKLPGVAKGLGNAFEATGNKLGQAVEGGLLGVPLSASNAAFSHHDYAVKAAAISYANTNAAQGYANYYAHMSAHGVPDDMAQRLAARHQDAVTQLAAVMPTTTSTPSPVPSRAQPPIEHQRAFIAAMNSAADPTYALHNPTPANMAIHKAVYPTLYSQTANSIIAALQQNADLPRAGKQWAGRVLGTPVDALSTPQFYMMKTAADHYNQAQQNAAGPRAKGGTQPANSVQSNLTRAQSLGNRSG